mgnify:CR=1 FL=1
MNIKPSDRGLGFIFVEAALVPLSIVIADVFLYIVSIFIAGAILLDLVYFIIVLKRFTCICRPGVYKRVWVWEKPIVDLAIECDPQVFNIDLVSQPSWLKVIGVEKNRGFIRVRARALFKHHGIYRLSKISVERTSLLALFKSRSIVDASIEFKVLPETLYWLVVALNILGFRGGAGGSRFVSEALPAASMLRSLSGVYYETREYLLGDPVKRIDWKATSRRQELMIREYREVFSDVTALLFDTRCIGPATCDAIASALLSLIITVIRQGIPLSQVYDLVDGRAIIFRDHKALLAYFINLVLEKNIVSMLDLYEYIEPLTTRELRRYLARIIGGKVFVRRSVKGRVLPIKKDVRNIVVVSMVLHSTREILDLMDRLIHNRVKPVLVMPLKPWIDIDDLEQAYRVYTSYNLVLKKLKKMGVRTILWRRRASSGPGSYPSLGSREMV